MKRLIAALLSVMAGVCLGQTTGARFDSHVMTSATNVPYGRRLRFTPFHSLRSRSALTRTTGSPARNTVAIYRRCWPDHSSDQPNHLGHLREIWVLGGAWSIQLFDRLAKRKVYRHLRHDDRRRRWWRRRFGTSQQPSGGSGQQEQHGVSGYWYLHRPASDAPVSAIRQSSCTWYLRRQAVRLCQSVRAEQSDSKCQRREKWLGPELLQHSEQYLEWPGLLQWLQHRCQWRCRASRWNSDLTAER